jgi:hypothetical protein
MLFVHDAVIDVLSFAMPARSRIITSFLLMICLISQNHIHYLIKMIILKIV